MPSIRQIEEDVNIFCGILDRSAKNEIEKADARRDIDIAVRLFHWIEFSEKMRKEAGKNRRTK